MTTSAVLAFFIAVVFISNSGAADYCNIASCRDKSSHTLCRYQTSGPSSRCTQNGNLGGAITASDRDLIVNRHNELRRRVANGQETRGRPGPQPAARSMPDLQWDSELATIAQRWADQCNYGHDACRNVDRYQVGQNIAQAWTTGPASSLSLIGMVNSWYDEVKDFNRNEVDSYSGGPASNGEQIGHYTQFVWAKTTRIGCGARKFASGNRNYYYVVCNYGPSGNFPGQPLYERR